MLLITVSLYKKYVGLINACCGLCFIRRKEIKYDRYIEIWKREIKLIKIHEKYSENRIIKIYNI